MYQCGQPEYELKMNSKIDGDADYSDADASAADDDFEDDFFAAAAAPASSFTFLPTPLYLTLTGFSISCLLVLMKRGSFLRVNFTFLGASTQLA